MTGIRQAARRLLRRAKYFTGDRTALLPIHVRFTPEGASRVITDDTSIVIEGFPRSGNTFAVFAFRDAQPKGVRVASHIHHLAPLKIAMDQQLPLLVVVRSPVDCLSSYLVAGPHARPAGVLREYIHHHAGVLALATKTAPTGTATSGGLVVATFDQVTNNLGSVIARVNDRFNTQFLPFEHEPEAETRVFDAITSYHASVHARKDPSRVAPKPDQNRRVEADTWRTKLEDPSLAKLRAEANDVYTALAALAKS